ncbi:DNA directed RNA polymerase III subunit RPC2 [Trichuris trichiura]|uniref:DNA-directed RNA polymerase subunit beta n=1 Tax=Trichuris trichiura TaxID=36087 RepID=A0A077ZG11_TRITR|nr:DNA directed RNA polymerase III subunit RPC2 [Trichuris trichiura]
MGKVENNIRAPVKELKVRHGFLFRVFSLALQEKWLLVPEFLKVRGLVKQHIESFNYFVDVEVIAPRSYNLCKMDPSFYFKYLDVRVETPNVEDGLMTCPITPHECRLRDMTYSAPILVDVEYTRGNERVQRTNLPLGRLPIMLHSNRCVLAGKSEKELMGMKECPLDPGGYFIARGSERVILIQEQLSKNRMLVGKYPSGEPFCEVLRQCWKNLRCLTCVNSFFKDIPICVMFRAMGIECDQEMAYLMGCEEAYVEHHILSLDESLKANITTQHSALRYLGTRVKTFLQYQSDTERNLERDALDFLHIVNFPADGLRHNMRRKAIYMGLMVQRIIQTEIGLCSYDDPDFYGNKRLELAGSLIAILFEDLFKRLNTELVAIADKTLSKQRATKFDIVKCIRKEVITTGLATGNWVVRRFRMDRHGVTQVLSRLSYISALGMMTRINSRLERCRQVGGPRALQPSQWGMLCPADTPEGEPCGLIKSLALMTHITTDSEAENLMLILFDLGVEDVIVFNGNDLSKGGYYYVFVNGNIVGVTPRPHEIVSEVRYLRRCGIVHEFVSVFLYELHRSVYIASDGGRLCRPYILIENGLPKLEQHHLDELASGKRTFNDCVTDGLLEYLDVNEENDANIAVYEKDINETTTHLEIEPFTILGVCAGLIPYPHHNQAPRNTYQCAMGKQAMGFVACNQQCRVDSLLYGLVYSQKPMVKTKTIDLLSIETLPAGTNATVAVMSYSGYDIEDAIILNRASLDRGFGRCTVHRSAKCALRRYPNGMSDRVNGPSIEVATGRCIWKHEALDADGIVRAGALVQNNQVLVNKMVPVTPGEVLTSLDNQPLRVEAEYKESPLVYRGPGPCYVEKVLITSNVDEHYLVKVLYRQTRVPELGDKFSSRHGQKGVCGLIVPQEDLPFNANGMSPDLIMNPHGFPSRMTVGKLMELLAGKVGVLTGRQRYGTVFHGDQMADIREELIHLGLNYHGKEMLTSGITGMPLSAYIYFGPIYYQKLKHMVMDKLHARSKGPREILTRQPTEGRLKEGGLRLGEMERDCLICYGTSLTLYERMMLSSDRTPIDVCSQCGLVSSKGW